MINFFPRKTIFYSVAPKVRWHEICVARQFCRVVSVPVPNLSTTRGNRNREHLKNREQTNIKKRAHAQRLIQQPQDIADSIAGQIENRERYTIALNADDDQDAVVRIQRNVLSKVQDKTGNPIKFLSVAKNAINIVAVDIADCMLGMMDIHDCMLACQGDSGVEEPYRRGVFGLFQPDMPHFTQSIHDLAKRYAHIRGTIHGILFLDRVGVKILTYRLCHYLVWNPALIDEPIARRILADVSTAIPAHPSLSNYEYE